MDKILIIDDDFTFLEALETALEGKFKVVCKKGAISGIKSFKEETPDIVITDLIMPLYDGLYVVKNIKQLDETIPIIVITAFEEMQSTIKAIQLGAYDYITKPLDEAKLKIAINRALSAKKMSDKLEISLSKEVSEYNDANSIIGKSPAINDIFKKIGKVSSNKINVLLQGESGTGKELIAKVIHYSGITKNEPFIAVNCSALTETLLESEMFGHVKGAFTDAVNDKKGQFQLAGEGTIFLDEISEISIHLQAKLLRVIQERELVKVGGENKIKVNARIIAATNRDLESMVDSGNFRADLYYRLNVFSITIPPLRFRKEDIPPLVIYFMKKINRELHKNVRKIPYEVMELLQNHIWVGNVRELENTLYQAVVLAKGDVLEKEYIMIHNNHVSEDYCFDKICDLTLEDIEKKYINYILKKTNGDKTRACEILNISRPTLYRKIEKKTHRM